MRTLILMVVLSITAAPVVANEIDVGGTKLVIPTPPGFAPVTPRMANLQDMLKTLVGASNVEYLSFISEQEVDAALDGELPPMERRFSVQVLKQLVEPLVSSGGFYDIRAEVRGRNGLIAAADGNVVSKTMDGLNERIEGDTGLNLQMQITGYRELGFHAETERMIATSTLLDYAFVDPAGQNVSFKAISTAAIVHVRGKVLFLFVHAEDGALEWSQAAIRDWTDAVLAANPPTLRTRTLEAMPSWVLGINWASVATNAAIGGLVGLVLTLWNRRRRQEGDQ